MTNRLLGRERNELGQLLPGPKQDRRKYDAGWKKTHPDSVRKTRNKYHHALRLKALEHLGGKCVRCGFSDERALQVDHINGGGRAEREKVGSQWYIYRMVLEDTTGKYQLLCANCNWIKRREKKEWGKKV